MHKATVALAAFVVFLGCNADSPTSPGAAKYSEAETEQCPMPILGITGTWARQARIFFSTADTLRIEFASDSNPTGEPGVTYYDYTLLSYYSPSDRDDPIIAEAFTGLAQPLLWWEERGKMGVYYADGGTWAFNYYRTYSRSWNAEAKEYEEGGYGEMLAYASQIRWNTEAKEYEEGPPFPPHWGLEIKMFDGWLVLGWDYDLGDDYDVSYRRVDE